MNRKAQSTMEYAIIIAVVAVAVFAMSAYVKRGMQGRLKRNADDLSDGGAYSPKATIQSSRITKKITENTYSHTETEAVGGGKTKDLTVTDGIAVLDQKVERRESILPFSREPER